MARLVQTLSRGLRGTCCLSVGGEAWNQTAPQQVIVQLVSKCGSVHAWLLHRSGKRPKDVKQIFLCGCSDSTAVYKMCLSYLNAVVSLPEAGRFHLERAALGDPLSQLHIKKKLVLPTGSPQQSTGFWDNSVAAKLKSSLFLLRIIFPGLTRVTGGYGLQSYLVSVELICKSRVCTAASTT